MGCNNFLTISGCGGSSKAILTFSSKTTIYFFLVTHCECKINEKSGIGSSIPGGCNGGRSGGIQVYLGITIYIGGTGLAQQVIVGGGRARYVSDKGNSKGDNGGGIAGSVPSSSYLPNIGPCGTQTSGGSKSTTTSSGQNGIFEFGGNYSEKDGCNGRGGGFFGGSGVNIGGG
jgi:hypothetical protein